MEARGPLVGEGVGKEVEGVSEGLAVGWCVGMGRDEGLPVGLAEERDGRLEGR